MFSFPILLVFLIVNVFKQCVGGNLTWQDGSYALYINQSLILNKNGGDLATTLLVGLTNETMEVQSRDGNVIGGQIRNSSLGQASDWFNLTNQISNFKTLTIDNNNFILVWHGKIGNDSIIYHQKFNKIGQNISEKITLEVKANIADIQITNLTSGYVIGWFSPVTIQFQQYTWEMETNEQVVTAWPSSKSNVTGYDVITVEMSGINENKLVITWIYEIDTPDAVDFIVYQVFDSTKPVGDIMQLASINNGYANNPVYSFGLPNGNYIVGWTDRTPPTQADFFIFDKDNKSVKNFSVPICLDAKLFLMGPPGINNWMLMCVGLDSLSSSSLYDVYGNYYYANGTQIGQRFTVAMGLGLYTDASLVDQDKDKSVFAVTYIPAVLNQAWLHANQYTMTYNNKKINVNKNHKFEKQNKIMY